jgi:hypothetical protein
MKSWELKIENCKMKIANLVRRPSARRRSAICNLQFSILKFQSFSLQSGDTVHGISFVMRIVAEDR